MPKKGYVAAPGTSFAAPEVAGIATILLEAKPGILPRQLKKVLMETAHDMGRKYDVYDEGAGFVDAKAAVDKLDA